MQVLIVVCLLVTVSVCFVNNKESFLIIISVRFVELIYFATTFDQCTSDAEILYVFFPLLLQMWGCNYHSSRNIKVMCN